MHHRAIYASFGASSGFSGAALWEWLTSPTTASGIAFLGSAASTVIGWVLAQRAEVNRARLERQKEEREQARHLEYLDALNAAAIKQIGAGTGTLLATPTASPP